mgnify:CR=1 FL=1
MLTYTIHLNAHGGVRFKTTVPAKESGLVGDYHNGVPYQPDNSEVRLGLPYRYRKAFDRALKWWHESSMSGRSLPLKCDLYTSKGAPMGTLYATPDWPAGVV